MKIITVTNQKGGCGKSTLSALIVRTLSAEGYDVLAVDCDPQGGLSSLLGAKQKPNLYDALLGDIVTPEQIGAFQILGADHRLDKIAYTLPPYEIETILKNHKNQFVVIDTPPTVQGISRAAAIASDVILIPADISKTTLTPTIYTIEALTAIKKAGKVLYIGKAPKADSHGFIKSVYDEFQDGIGKSYAGFIPRSANAQKAAIGQSKVPSAISEIIRGLI